VSDFLFNLKIVWNSDIKYFLHGNFKLLSEFQTCSLFKDFSGFSLRFSSEYYDVITAKLFANVVKKKVAEKKRNTKINLEVHKTETSEWN